MLYNKKWLMILSIITLIGCTSESDQDPYSACKSFDDTEAEILDLLQKIRDKHSGDRLFLKAFEMEQVYWTQYRERRIRALYPEDWNRVYRKDVGTEVFNNCKCKEYNRLAESRIEDLNYYLEEGPKDQEECPSMLNQ
jgi:hypothetical protein